MTTESQANYIRVLLVQNGYTKFKMKREHEELPHADLGYDTVDEWLENLTTQEAGHVIDYLKAA